MVHGDSSLGYALIAGCLFLLVIATLHHYTRKNIFPFESWLVFAGVFYAVAQPYLTQDLPSLQLTPEMVMYLILPILIFSSGRAFVPQQLLKAALPISYLAVLGSVFSMLVIGTSLAWVLNIPWSHGLMFGAAVAATDPSAVGVIFKRFNVPSRLETLIEGGSLFNDGVAIVLFSVLAGSVLMDVELRLIDITQQLLWAVVVAVPLGFLCGWLMGRLVSYWQEQNQFVGLTLTLVLAYSTFLLADIVLHTSGVITVLIAALIFVRTRFGRGERPTSAEASDLFQSFWGYLNTLASSLLFFSLGVAVGAHAFFWSWAIPVVVFIVAASRAILVYGGALLQPSRMRWPRPWRHLIMLGGLRGAVSAALVQMIPLDYPYRIAFLCLVFVLVMVSMIVNPPLLRVYQQRHPLQPRY